MRALIADDDRGAALLARRGCERLGLDITVASDGEAAWNILIADDQPSIAVLDWMMPGLDGVELCRRLRVERPSSNIYILLVTARESRADIVEGLDAGADDYVVKPFDLEELRARLQVGIRMVQLREELATRVAELQAALAQVRQLDGLLPICSYCKRIRNDQAYWEQIETYLADRSEAQFSHGICPECLAKVRDQFER